MQLRRLGARGVNLYTQRELSEDAQRRDAEEELRLFHVGATRARERLLLSGVVSPSPPSRRSNGEAVIERIVAGLEIDRERDSRIAVAAPEPRPGLATSFEPSEIAVRVNLASAERASTLAAVRKELGPARDTGAGPAPLVAARTARAARRPLSYTAISAAGDLAQREKAGDEERAVEGGVTRGRAVHALLEWSHANGWQAPAAELVRRVSASAEVGNPDLAEEALLAPFQAWLDSDFFAERVRDAKRSRAEVPLLIEVAGTVLRGSIDLLIEEDGCPPLIVDYKTDRIDGREPAELAARYEIQQAIYALAVAEARGAEEVELAYVFLERPEEPVVTRWGPGEIEAGRSRLEGEIVRIRKG
jgi:ATP-dependent exoDNAse (exonuclease V) beta subunit